MAQVADMYRCGIIKPIDYIKTFDIADLEKSMMYFANGTHIGKAVVTFEDSQAMLRVGGYSTN